MEDDASSLSDPPPTPPTSSNGPNLLEEDDDDELVAPSSKRRKINRRAVATTSVSSPLRRSMRFGSTSPRRESSTSRSSRRTHIELDSTSPSPGVISDVGSAESTDDDADVLASAPTKRKRAKASTKTNYLGARPQSLASYVPGRSVDQDGWLVNDDEVEYMSSDDAEPVRRKAPRSEKTSRSAKRRSRREQEELEADLDDLRGSESEHSASIPRTRGGPVTAKRDETREQFDLLRRRRAGEKIPRVYDSDEDGSEQGADINYIGRPSQAMSDQGSVHSSLDTDQGDESEPRADGDDNFIEDDEHEEPEASRRPRSDIPLEFTPWMTAKPRELFPHIIEWLVKNKIAPAFPRDDDIFKLAFQRVNDQVAAQAGSRLISSAWNAEFRNTILARPDIAIALMPGDEDDRDTCDACNKSNHPARYDFVLSGQAYNMKTLEPIEKDSDAEDDDGDNRDDASVDEKGRVLASQTRHFHLGSHCTANAQMGHKLTHWKYHLNETLLQHLEEQGVLSAEAIVAREKKSRRKREKEAEAIVDTLEETGKIDDLWGLFQTDLKDAMLGMSDYAVRGGRSRGRFGVVQARTVDGKTRTWNNDRYRERVTLSDSE